MKEVISYFASNSDVLLSIGDTITVIIAIAGTFYKVVRLGSRMEMNLEELKANQTVMKEDLEVLKKNTGKLKTNQAVTKSKLKELKTRARGQAKELKSLRDQQNSESIEFNKRWAIVEVNPFKEVSGNRTGATQVSELSCEELNEFRAENRRSFLNMQDLLWYIRQDIRVFREMFGIRNSESADVKGHATA